jgi:signal transduction histidine kinase
MPDTDGRFKVLILEDVPEDAELMIRELRKSGLDCVSQIVFEQEKFIEAIEKFQPDVMLVDYAVPKLRGDQSLKLCIDKCPNTPFIYVSGTIGEEVAIEALTNGATDYVLKNQLSKLGPAVQRALSEAKVRADRKAAADRLLLLQQREDFIAILTHDLKTPLIAVESGLYAVLEEEFGPLSDELRRILTNLRLENLRLLEMIKTLLELYRYEGAAAESVFQEVDLVAVLDNCLPELKAEAEHRKIDIEISCPRGKVSTYADPLAMRHVFNNLVDNAIQYADYGSTVYVSIGDLGDSVELLVRNYGPPIDPKEKLQLFKNLGRRKLGASVNTGLGLYLVGKIVETHGGEIQCASTEADGTTFTVRLLPHGRRLAFAQGQLTTETP